MKPAPFRYFAPDTLEEALSLLGEHGGSAKILAGGQSLIPLMAFRLARPSVLVDLRKIESLRDYHLTGDTLTIGSMVTHRTIQRDQGVSSRCVMIAEALDLVGHVAIRNVGTVGGSLAHADPAAEWPALALALDAEMTILGGSGRRVVSADDFFTGYMTTSTREDEVLTAVRMKMPAPRSGSAFGEVARRHGDFAIVGVAAVVQVDDSVISDARVSLLGAAMTPVRAHTAESIIIGTALSPTELVAVGEAATSDTSPLPDLHGSVDFKRHLAAALTRRIVALAYQRARSSS